MLTYLIVLIVSCQVTQSSITFVSNKLTTSAYRTQKSLEIIDLVITHDTLQKKMTLQGQQYICYIPITNHLIAPYVPINETVQASEQIVKPLKYKCATHRTRQFIYEVCSGQYVRQYDDQITVQNMAKKAFQKFILGLGNKTSQISRPNSRIISSVSLQNRFIVVQGIHGRTNFRLPYEAEKYGNDRIELRCHNNLIVSRNILLVSHYHFILLGQPAPYCFSRQHSNIFIDTNRILLINSLLVYNNILVGDCYTEGPYVFLRLDNVQLKPAFIQQKIREDIHMIDIKIGPDVRSVKCEGYSMREGQQLQILQFQIKVDGYLLYTAEPIRFDSIDSLVLTYYDPKTRKQNIVHVFIDFSFSNFIHLLKEKLDQKVSSNIINFMYGRNKGNPAAKAKEVFVREPDNFNTSESSSSIFQTYILKDGQKIRIDITNKYIVIKGNIFSAKLIGEQWVYYIKEKSLKVRILKNGSKQIIHQNKHYQNKTFSDEYFHLNEFCIWAESDEQNFCRLSIEQFHTIEALSDIQLTVYNLSASENKHLKMNQRKRGNNPVVYEQKYANGDLCAQPINKARSTSVIYVCGQNWFSIKNVSQVSPCQYKVYVESQLLCQEGYRYSRPVEPTKDIICLRD